MSLSPLVEIAKMWRYKESGSQFFMVSFTESLYSVSHRWLGEVASQT